MQLLTYKGAEPRAMMQKIVAEQGSNARVVSLKEGRYGGIFGFFAKQGFVLTVEVDEKKHMQNIHRDLAAVQPTNYTESMKPLETPHSTEELISQLAEQTTDVFEVQGTKLGPQTFDDALEIVTASLGSDPIAFAQEWAELNRMSETSTITELAIEPLGAITPAPDIVNSSSDEDGAMYLRLRSAGYPLALLAELMGTGVSNVTLDQAFSIVKQAPTLPRAPGSLVAIVGPSERAIELAAEIAGELKVDPSDVAIVTNDVSFLGSNPLPVPKIPPTHPQTSASARSTQHSVPATRKRATNRTPRPPFGPGLVAHDVDGAIDLMPGWRRDRVGVVVVACDASVTTYTWVRSVLRAIMPSFVYLAARASTKSEDIHLRAHLIGGVDAILLDGLNESMTPLSALGLDIPVARLDGKIADPKVWAGVVASLPPTKVEY